MRTTLLFIALACALISGCTKDDTKKTDAMTYTINGLTDLNLEYKDEKMVPLAITHTGGTQEKITLSVTGLPSQATATFDVASGIPSFATVLTFKTNYADAGTYDINVNSITASGDTSSFPIKMKINPEPAAGCAEYMFGNYAAKYEGSINKTDAVTAEGTGTKNELLFKNFDPGNIVGKLNCDLKTITVESQETQPGVYVSGTGSYDDTDITLNLYIKNNIGTQLGYYICYLSR